MPSSDLILMMYSVVEEWRQASSVPSDVNLEIERHASSSLEYSITDELLSQLDEYSWGFCDLGSCVSLKWDPTRSWLLCRVAFECFFMWHVKLLLWLNFLLHTAHIWERSPVWILRCWVKLCLCLKDFPQIEQEWGFSSEWVFMWVLRVYFWLNDLLQT